MIANTIIPVGDVLHALRNLVSRDHYLPPTTPSDRPTIAAFDAWHARLHIRHFSVSEIVTPNHRDKAKACGYEHFIPPTNRWPWVALVLKLSDIVRDAVDAPVKMRNLWRPPAYNAMVGGAKNSDHIHACAADLDFKTTEHRRIAEQTLRAIELLSLVPHAPRLNLSLGLGAKTIHVGAMSPGGRRQWYYDDYPDAEKRPFPTAG